jgi:hypothetical protein
VKLDPATQSLAGRTIWNVAEWLEAHDAGEPYEIHSAEKGYGYRLMVERIRCASDCECLCNECQAGNHCRVPPCWIVRGAEPQLTTPRCTGHDPNGTQCDLPFGHPPPCSPYRRTPEADITPTEVIACVLGPMFGVGSEMAGDIVAALGEAVTSSCSATTEVGRVSRVRRAPGWASAPSPRRRGGGPRRGAAGSPGRPSRFRR